MVFSLPTCGVEKLVACKLVVVEEADFLILRDGLIKENLKEF